MNTRGSAGLSGVVLLLLLGWGVLIVVAGVRALPDTPPLVSPTMAILVGGSSLLVLVLGVVVASVPSARKQVTRDSSFLEWVYRLAAILAAGATVEVGVGLQWHLVGTPTEAPPDSIAVPASGLLPAGPKFDALLAYAQSLTYDDITHGTADSGYVVDDSGVALKAWIAPAKGADFIPYDALERRGYVVARIRIDTIGGRGYGPLGLPPGVSYLWVDSLEIQDNDTTGTFRAFIIPDHRGAGVLPFPGGTKFTYLRSKGKFANFPMSRWLLHHSSCFNTGCSAGCCQVCSN